MQRYEYIREQEIPGTGYTYVRRLDKGGVGEIYLVESKIPKGDRWVLKLPYVGGPGVEERFEQEAQVLSILQRPKPHPNIVSVLPGGRTGEKDQRLFFVMPWMQGKSLEKAIAEWSQPFDVMTTAGTIIPVLEALVHSHEKRIIHRDLKPANIFLEKPFKDAPTRVMVIDFGIAHILEAIDDAPVPSGKKRFMGTLRYASPEQIEGSNPTFKTDIHAVGLILFEMLTGRRMFDEAEHQAEPGSHGSVAFLADAVLTMRRLRVSWFVEDIPTELCDLVFRMTAIDPAERPTPQEAIDALRGIVSRIPVRSEDPASADGHDTDHQPIEALLAGTHANITGDRALFPPPAVEKVTKIEIPKAAPPDPPSAGLLPSIIFAESSGQQNGETDARRIFSTQPAGPPDFHEVPTADAAPVVVHEHGFRSAPTASFNPPPPRVVSTMGYSEPSPATMPLPRTKKDYYAQARATAIEDAVANRRSLPSVLPMPATLRSADAADTVESSLPIHSPQAVGTVYWRLLWIVVGVLVIVLAWIIWSQMRAPAKVGQTWTTPSNVAPAEEA